MPPANPNTRGSSNNIKVPIHSLSGGVGRQAPSKRTPLEAQDIDNALVTLERSVEKRPGTVVLESFDANFDAVPGGRLGIPADADLVYEWFFVSDELRYLLVVDYSATQESDQLIYIYKYTDTDVVDVSPTFASDAATRSYITYNPGGTHTGTDALRFTQVGPKIMILNTLVKAGYSSVFTGTNWELVGLDGLPTGVRDLKGGEVTYLTASDVDPDGLAIIWTPDRIYVSGVEVLNSTGVWRATENVEAADSSPGISGPYSPGDTVGKWEYVRDTEKIPVDDDRYPDATKRYLGQSLFDFSEIKLPPRAPEVLAPNGAEEMLEALYPDTGNADGLGKIYYVENAYATSLPGFYRITNAATKPYFQKVRTPDAYSRFAPERMPHVLSFDSGSLSWSLDSIDWSDRVSGDRESNPGPQIFKDGAAVEIKSLAFFRDRLWLSAEDSVFSSRAGQIEDFFLNDPSIIGDEDPIDVRLSTNKYTPVSYMTPFETYLFINTPADVQFLLSGSENLITPLTAEVSPVSFYSTAPLIEPILMGSQVYFYAPERMYLYLPDTIQSSITSTIEVSQHCPDYLPENFGDYCVVPSQDTIMVVDRDTPTDVYVYTNRFNGNQVSQSSFCRYQFSNVVESISSTKGFVYMVSKDSDGGRTIGRMKFYETNTVRPLLDNQKSIRTAVASIVYDGLTNTTAITFPDYSNPSVDSLMFNIDDDQGRNELTGVLIEYETAVQENGDLVFTVNGNLMPLVVSATTSSEGYDPADLLITAGTSYTMNVELSPQFSRDQNNNAIDGVLSLRTLHTRHFNTGNYRILVAPDGQTFRKSSEFNASTISGSKFADAPIDPQGESVAKLFGFSDTTRIRIVSDYPTPCNITNMEIKGRFRSTFSSFIR